MVIQYSTGRINFMPRGLLLTVSVMVCGVAAQAGLFPKLMKQAPQELQSEYFLLARMEPGRTNEVFAKPPPFATIYSNRVVLADGAVRMIEGVIRVRQKGTNVYMMSFEGEVSWAVVQCDRFKLVVMEHKGKDSKRGMGLVMSRKPTLEAQTNGLPARPQDPADTGGSRRRRL